MGDYEEMKKAMWQAGYDEGRRMGTKHMYAEVDRLKAENEELRDKLEDAYSEVREAYSRMDGE